MSKKKLPGVDRVRIWNSFLHLARDASARLGKGGLSNTTQNQSARAGGRLSEEQEAVLAALTFCTLAIEARVNHLLEERREKGKMTRAVYEATLWLAPQHKWFLLPQILGCRRHINESQPPHRAIAEICKRRNSLVHVNFARLRDSLPSASEMIDLYRNFVDAMEDMNVVLGRTRRARKYVNGLKGV